MSRSRRSTPICGWSKAKSEKADKRFANRQGRRIVRRAVQDGDDLAGLIGRVGHAATFAKDGRQRFDPAVYPGLMRK